MCLFETGTMRSEYMKKVVAICLALVLCASLTACAGAGNVNSEAGSAAVAAIAETSEQQALEEADKLVAEGKYQEALDLLNNVESFRMISDKIESITAEKEDAERAGLTDLLVGRWVREDSTSFDYGVETWEFFTDGTLHVSGSGWDVTSPDNSYEWSVHDGLVSTLYGDFRVVESNGMYSLLQEPDEDTEDGQNKNPYNTCFIRESDYEKKFVRVELTMENVDDYIQLDVYGRLFADDGGNTFGNQVMVGGKSKVASEGLRYVGAENFYASVSTSDANGTYEDYLSLPYDSEFAMDDSRRIDGFLEVSGALIFVKTEFVADQECTRIDRGDFVSAIEEYNRILTLDDGCRIVNYILKDYEGDIPKF